MKHLVNWIEIPVTDLDRACRFYGRVLGVELSRLSIGGAEYALFPTEDHFNAGALVKTEGHLPASNGALVYLDGGSDWPPCSPESPRQAGRSSWPRRSFRRRPAGWASSSTVKATGLGSSTCELLDSDDPRRTREVAWARATRP